MHCRERQDFAIALTGAGGALLSKAASGGATPTTAVLASAGLLSIFNLAVTDNQRFAAAKRAVKVYEGKSLPGLAVKQFAVAKKWYKLVALQIIGELAGLIWMIRGNAFKGAATFMAANVLFFVLGAGDAKHDMLGLPAPMKPKLQKFVLTTDLTLLVAALLAAYTPIGTILNTVGALLLSAGLMIGAVEGVPKWLGALTALRG